MAVRLYALQSGHAETDARMAPMRPHYLLAGDNANAITELASACTSWLQLGANMPGFDLSLTTISRVFTSIGEYEGSTHVRDAVVVTTFDSFRQEIRSSIRVEGGAAIPEERIFNAETFSATFGGPVTGEGGVADGDAVDPFRSIRCGDHLMLTEEMFAWLLHNRQITISITESGVEFGHRAADGSGAQRFSRHPAPAVRTSEPPADPNVMQRSFTRRMHVPAPAAPSGGPVETRPEAPAAVPTSAADPTDIALQNAVLRALMDIDGHTEARAGDVPRVPDVPGLVGRPYAVAYHDEVMRVARLFKVINRVQRIRATGGVPEDRS